MKSVTAESSTLRAALVAQRDLLEDVMSRYRASNPRIFGSVARGDASTHSDIDLLVDLHPDGGNALLRLSGIAEELSNALGTRVDVVSVPMLRTKVSQTAPDDAVDL